MAFGCARYRLSVSDNKLFVFKTVPRTIRGKVKLCGFEFTRSASWCKIVFSIADCRAVIVCTRFCFLNEEVSAIYCQRSSCSFYLFSKRMIIPPIRVMRASQRKRLFRLVCNFWQANRPVKFCICCEIFLAEDQTASEMGIKAWLETRQIRLLFWTFRR